MIRLKRVYEAPAPGDGVRFLVDRLWPRGVSRDRLSMEAWLKEAAPSDALRRWYRHGPARWTEFRRRYFEELDGRPESWRPILEAARRGTVTLLYASREPERNNAAALRAYLEARPKDRRFRVPPPRDATVPRAPRGRRPPRRGSRP